MWCMNNTCLLCGVCFVVHGVARVVLFHLIRSRGGGLHCSVLGAVSFFIVCMQTVAFFEFMVT